MSSQDPDWDLLSSYAGLLTLATTSIYAGSFGSLKPKKVKKEKKVVKGLTGIITVIDEGDDGDDDDDDEDEVLLDRISSGDAYLFPILGSIVLVGLYLVVKFLGKEWINRILNAYFTFTGIASVWKCAIALSQTTIGKSTYKSFGNLKFLILQNARELLSIKVQTLSLYLFPLAVIPSTLFYFLPGQKTAILTNILALSFAHNALSIIKLDSFRTGTILLIGLFLYDIWWVFGTEVMLKVATSLEAPVKILWPKSLLFSTERGYSLLGLGDIVVPGLFISLALRYDYSRVNNQGTVFSKPYFTMALVAYVIGLVITMCVMHFFHAAQPALLYLSPACILSFVLTAISRGELSSAWAWKDASEEKKPESNAKETNGVLEQAKPATDAVQDIAVTTAGEVDKDKEVDVLDNHDDDNVKKKKSKKKQN